MSLLNKVDLTSKNSSIIILLILDMIFFIVAILSAGNPTYSKLGSRMWELFSATNGALFLAINVGGPQDRLMSMMSQLNPNMATNPPVTIKTTDTAEVSKSEVAIGNPAEATHVLEEPIPEHIEEVKLAPVTKHVSAPVPVIEKI